MTDRELVFALTGLFCNDVELIVSALTLLERNVPFEEFNLYYKEMNDLVRSLETLLENTPIKNNND